MTTLTIAWGSMFPGTLHPGAQAGRSAGEQSGPVAFCERI